MATGCRVLAKDSYCVTLCKSLCLSELYLSHLQYALIIRTLQMVLYVKRENEYILPCTMLTKCYGVWGLGSD